MRGILLASLWVLGVGVFGDVRANTAWELIHSDTFDWRDEQARREVAEDLESRVQLLARAVPDLSAKRQQAVAATRERLANEESSARQRSRFYLSRDYQHQELRVLLGSIQQGLRCVLEADALIAEMACWAAVSNGFLREKEIDLALSVLRDAKLVPRDSSLPIKAQDPLVWYQEYGRGVLDKILLPYLTAQAESAR